MLNLFRFYRKNAEYITAVLPDPVSEWTQEKIKRVFPENNYPAFYVPYSGGEPFITWIFTRNNYLSDFFNNKIRDMPMVQTLEARKRDSFARAPFLAYGMVYFNNKNTTHTIRDVNEWLTGISSPYFFCDKNYWKVISPKPITDMGYSLPFIFKSIFFKNPEYTYFTTKEKVLEHINDKDCVIPSIKIYPPYINDTTNQSAQERPKVDYRKMYCVIDIGTVFSGKEELVMAQTKKVKDCFAIFFTEKGTVVNKISTAYYNNRAHFYVDLFQQIVGYQAELVMYNAAFDRVVMSCDQEFPFGDILKNIIIHDVMWIAKSKNNTTMCQSLEKAYQTAFGFNFPKKLHVSENDCEATKDVFLKCCI